ncbi:hypothetical protein Tco_0247263 [Tanacetum coccineum]
MAGEDEFHDDNPPPPPLVTPTQQAPHTLSTIKLPILKKGVSTEDVNLKFLGLYRASWSMYPVDNGGTKLTQNVAFVSSESTNSTNDVSTAYGVSTSSGHNSQKEGSSSYTDELKYSFFANQSSGPQLDHEDLEQVDEFDLEEMDLKWQVAMISMRLKKSYKKTGRRLQFDDKEPVGFHKTKTGHAEDEQENFALMAYSNSSSDTKKNQLWYEEKIRFMKIDLDDKTDVLTYHKKLLAEAVKEKEELKTKLENFQSSSKGLSKLLNSQMSTRDKSGLGYGNQIHKGVLSYEKEVLESVFDSRSSDVEDSPVYDRFAKVEGMHAVPPPMTGNYMPPKSDFGIDESNFTYGPKQSKTSESDAKTSDFDSCETNSSVETLESVPEPVVVEPKVVSQPKVWSDAPIIEEYKSDINAARQNPSSEAAETRTARKVNTARPIVNEIRQRNNFYKSHSPIRRPFKKSIAPKANFTNHKVHTDGDKTVSAVRGYRETAVKASAGCNWRPKRHYWTKVSKYNSGSNSNKNVNFKDPQGRPKSAMAWVSKRN